MEFMTILLFLSPIVVFLYIYINRKYSYWSNQGISGPPNIFPFGDLFSRLKAHPIRFELDYDKKYGKLYGVYNGTNPTLTISDPEMVKTVLVKDFHLFINRRNFRIRDRYWKHNLFNNVDEDWKRIRSITTRSFTTGKLRRMFPLLKKATDRLEDYLSEISKKSDNSFDAKSVSAAFTMSVIASTSFGTDLKFKELMDTKGLKKNPFLEHGQDFFNTISFPRFLAILSLPMTILKLLGIKHGFKYESFDFFVNVCKAIVARSEKRDDFISILREVNVSEDDLKNINYHTLMASSDNEKSGENNKPENSPNKNAKFLTDDEIIGQSLVFLIAGFETTSGVIMESLFHISHNQAIQDRLYEEVSKNLADKDPSDLNDYYETINRLPYLEAVIKESLRMYPPVPRLERRLTGAESYTLGGAKLLKGHVVEISTASLHYDETLHPTPYEYNPNRFMPENKHKLVPYSFLPFGDGPRMRFAYQEAKICLASIILKYRFETNSDTPSTIQFPHKNVVASALTFGLSVTAR